jgi:Mg2+ and Co2+ transporter CorA
MLYKKIIQTILISPFIMTSLFGHGQDVMGEHMGFHNSMWIWFLILVIVISLLLYSVFKK